jgi:hypothetical protein
MYELFFQLSKYLTDPKAHSTSIHNKDGQIKILIKTYIRRIFTPQFHSD